MAGGLTIWVLLGQAEEESSGIHFLSEGWFPWLAIFLLFVISGLIVLWVNMRLARRAGEPDIRVLRQLITGGGVVVVVALAVLIAPMQGGTREQVLKVLGLALTAVVAFGSTTFVSNAMAGLLLRSLRNFRPGDFLRVEEEFGRVTERGLFHTEIQTEDRDLTTLPNLYLITRPVKVIHASGTIVSATVSLGYDVAHHRIEELLLEAGKSAELKEPFVQVLELGDFSVTYRLAGFLEDVKHILSSRSRLRREMLDALHTGGVEIVSPTFMNQRRIEPGERFIPVRDGRRVGDRRWAEETVTPEDLIFDKAEEAGRLEELRKERQALDAQLKELGQKKDEKEEGNNGDAEAERTRIRERVAAMDEEIKAKEKDIRDRAAGTVAPISDADEAGTSQPAKPATPGSDGVRA